MLTFVPGTMCDRRVWRRVWEEMGLASPGYIPVELQRTQSDIRVAFDEAAATGPLDLIGFSMGGYAALSYTLDYPERVRSLIVICSSAYGLSETEKADRRKVIAFLETHEYRGISTARINQFVHPSHQNDPAVVDVIRAMDRDLGQEVLLAQMRETSERASLMGRLREISCPLLLVAADGDRLVRRAEIEEMHDLIPGSDLAVAQDAGHMLPLEQPQWLAEKLLAFQRSHAA